MTRAVSDQVVVIAGASSGIGRAAALRLARSGARVVCAARNESGLRTLLSEITDAGGQAIMTVTDVADPEAVYALADEAEARFGRIDTWVNNAGVSVWGRVDDITDAEFDRVMRVNFLGHVHGVHAALPALRRAGGGVIIGISSLEGARAVPLQAPYAASKWALRGFYDSLRTELAAFDDGIHVTTILPAAIDTPFFEHARSKIGSMPKPPPPTYAPEVVAEAILKAATRPTREVPIGGVAVAFMGAQRMSPALADAVLSLRRVALGLQRTDRPDNGTDNVDAPVDEPGQVRGNYPGTVLRHSPYTRWIGQRRRPSEVLSGIATRARTVGRAVAGAGRRR